MNSWFFPIANGIMQGVFALFCHWSVERRGLVPAGPFIVMANHCSTIDPPLVNASLRRQVVFLAKRELFQTTWWRRWVLVHYGAIPLNRRGLDRAALRTAEGLLENGTALGLFPEGTRSPTGVMQQGRRGAALLALQTGVRVLPVAIYGSEKIRKWHHLFRRPRVTVIIGEAFALPQGEGEPEKTQIAAATELVMERIADLLPPERRGAYGAALT